MEESLSCDCSIGVEMGPSVARDEIRTARKQHKCCECGNPILPGDKYEYATGRWDGEWSHYKTCVSCKWIRDRYCSHGFVYGQLFEQIEECARFNLPLTGSKP